MGESERSGWETCILGKNYPTLTNPHVGISAGNPSYSNVNEIDVESIDFYNLN